MNFYENRKKSITFLRGTQQQKNLDLKSASNFTLKPDPKNFLLKSNSNGDSLKSN
jgi:hypothetical protein